MIVNLTSSDMPFADSRRATQPDSFREAFELANPERCFVGQAVVGGELHESLRPHNGIGSARPPDFGLAFGTELQRLSVRFRTAA